MENRLNDDTQQKARELARKITVAHDLDPEIQEELYGHIEDKLLAYKSGEERISDEDAFILVREHFGDTAVLAALFARVHQETVAQDHCAGETAHGKSPLDRYPLTTRRRIMMAFACVMIGAAGWIQVPDALTLDILVARMFSAVLLATVLTIHFVSIPREIKRGRPHRAGALFCTTLFLMVPAAFLSVYSLNPDPIAFDSRKIVALVMFGLAMAFSGAMAWASWRKGVEKQVKREDIIGR